MPKQVDSRIIEDIAIELGLSPSFLEKDLYAVRFLSKLMKFEYQGARLIFTGGTCLSKGYKIIKRFSEDIDFRVFTKHDFTRRERRQFRDFVLDKVRAFSDFKLLEDSLIKANESRFFSFDLEYPKRYTKDKSLRDNLKLEFSFVETLLETKKCKVNSIVSDYTKDSLPLEMDCISLIELGADKLSALMWRVDARYKKTGENSALKDPSIIRHLHDLAALEKYILEDTFKQFAELAFQRDKGRGGSDKDLSLKEFTQKTLKRLKQDLSYSKEYKDFVEALSYASKDEFINFESALEAFQRISNFIQSGL